MANSSDIFPASESDAGDPAYLDRILKDKFGLARAPFEATESDDDWTFVVKMHGFAEVAVNQMLTRYFKNATLTEVLCKLDINNERRGKLALVKAFHLLPEDGCKFVSRLSSMRSEVVHDVKWLGLDIGAYIKDPAHGGLENWKRVLTWWALPVPQLELPPVELHPRQAIFVATTQLMLHALLDVGSEYAPHVFDAIKSQAQAPQKPGQSNPS